MFTPAPDVAAASGQVLTLQLSNDSVIFGSFDPSTGKLHVVASHSGYVSAGFRGVDTKKNRAFATFGRQLTNGSYAFDLVTLDVHTGKITNVASVPSAFFLSAYDPAVGLEGLVEVWQGTSPPALSIITMNPTTGVAKTIKKLNSTFDVFSAGSVSVADHLLFSDMVYDSNQTTIATFDLRTGALVQIAFPIFVPLRPSYVRPWKTLVDTGFYFANNEFGLITFDPATGTRASLNITLLQNTNSVEVGPNALDPASQTYFTSLCPSGLGCSFFQVNLSTRAVVRTLQFSLSIMDMAWYPAA